eukprot:16808-Rhodomonas_salina.1
MVGALHLEAAGELFQFRTLHSECGGREKGCYVSAGFRGASASGDSGEATLVKKRPRHVKSGNRTAKVWGGTLTASAIDQSVMPKRRSLSSSHLRGAPVSWDMRGSK